MGGVVSLTINTVLLPIAVTFIVRRKKKDFDVLFGEEFLQTVPLPEKERLWSQFVKTDVSPYRSIYSGFEYNWIYFQAILMLVKALVCFATLGLEPNTTSQLAAIIAVQSMFSLATFYAVPFILDLCDWIMGISQVYVMTVLALTTLHRANESLSLGLVLNVVSGCTLVGQLVGVVFPAAR